MGCQGSVEVHSEHKAHAALVSKAEKVVAEKMRELCMPEGNKATRIEMPSSLKAQFLPEDRVIVSYPGIHGKAWNYLMHNCKEMDGIRTSCSFLPDRSHPNYGLHVGFRSGLCSCFDIYDGVQMEFGCKWFEQWKARTDRAARRGCQLLVVTKWDESLGRSQRAELRYLQSRHYKFLTLTVEQFVAMVCEPVLLPEKFSPIHSSEGSLSGATTPSDVSELFSQKLTGLTSRISAKLG